MYGRDCGNQYAGTIFFFRNIEEVIMYGNDCDKLICMNDVFLP